MLGATNLTFVVDFFFGSYEESNPERKSFILNSSKWITCDE